MLSRTGTPPAARPPTTPAVTHRRVIVGPTAPGCNPWWCRRTVPAGSGPKRGFPFPLLVAAVDFPVQMEVGAISYCFLSLSMRRSSIRGKYILQHLKEMLLFCRFLLVYCHHIVAISKKRTPPTCEAGKGLTGRVQGGLRGAVQRRNCRVCKRSPLAEDLVPVGEDPPLPGARPPAAGRHLGALPRWRSGRTAPARTGSRPGQRSGIWGTGRLGHSGRPERPCCRPAAG